MGQFGGGQSRRGLPDQGETGRVVVTRCIPQPGLDTLENAGVAVEVFQEHEERGVAADDLRGLAQRADVLLCLLTEPVDRALLEVNPRLLGVAIMAVGFDNIDVAAATELGIPVSNTPGVLTETSADTTWALLLAVARQIPQAHAYTKAGRFRLWGPNLFLGGDVGPGASGRRKVLGVVGFGRIGRAVARRARGFRMEVLAHDPFQRKEIDRDPQVRGVELDELLARSDFVTLHTALTDETRHQIGEAQLRAMKPDAYLVNAARGEVVDENALVRALREGWIRGAALDVYEREPKLAEGLAELSNVVLLPHILSASVETRGRMAEMAAENALAHLRGKRAPNPVNPEVYATAAYRRRRGD